MMMNKSKYNLIELDVNKLFVEHKIEEIVEIEKLLDAEIERKRTELRSMVGDRYKDILTASDSIKSMKTISSQIVTSIENIQGSCESLLKTTDCTDKTALLQLNERTVNERILAIQVRLAIAINEAIWMFLDKDDYLNGAQVYLLGQNIHTGLTFSNSLDTPRVPLLKHVKSNLASIRDIILQKIIKKLESVELTSEQACSNLNSLMLLQHQNAGQLMSIFMDHRKIALITVINNSHPSVRIQTSAMMKCLITTIHLLYDCFMYDSTSGSTSGLIFKQLEEIVSEKSEPTLSKVKLPFSPLEAYIPQIIKEFKPKFKIPCHDESIESRGELIEAWLKNTKDTVKLGLCKSLDLVTNIKGLHIIREEALKIELPENWKDICESVNLPRTFDVWNYFFQSLITARAQELIANKLKNIIEDFKRDIETTLKVICNSNINELDLRAYIWSEDSKDIAKFNNQHTGLNMKAMGFSQTIVTLCKNLDGKFFELLCDLFQYLFGVEYDGTAVVTQNFVGNNCQIKKYVDIDILQKCLVQECHSMNLQLSEALSLLLNEETSEQLVKKMVFCIRLLQAITILCPSFKKCCSMNNMVEEWHNVCENFSNCSTEFWKVWVDYSVGKTEKACLENFKSFECKDTLGLFLRWDCIEIQEQTEDKVFKSQIKVPLKPSAPLQNILVKLNENLCCILPHTVPKNIHVQFIEKNVEVILNCYENLSSASFNQNHALQLLFDVKFLTIFCVRRENDRLVGVSQNICDKLREKIDPFDLDVFYMYLQNNVKRAVVQSQVILGCLLPSYMQTSNIESAEKNKEHDKDACILAVSNPSTSVWFPLLPITAPSHKHFEVFPIREDKKISKSASKQVPKKTETAGLVKSNAASLFGGLTTDWFS